MIDRQRLEAIDRYEVSLRQANKHSAHDEMIRLLCEWARKSASTEALPKDSIAVPYAIIHEIDEAACGVLNFTDDTPAEDKSAAWTALDAAVRAWHQFEDASAVSPPRRNP